MEHSDEALIARIEKLEAILLEREHSAEFDEKIRDIIFFDQDTKTSVGSSTSVVTGVNFGAQTVTTANIAAIGNAAKFLRLYFRGKVYNIPVYTIS